jgi:PAS domain S-box-containing protein
MVLKKEISLQIKNLLKENPHGLIITDIVKKVNINRNTAGRYLENLLVSGQVEMRRFGMAKIYTLSQRVPLSALLSISSELVLQLDSSLRIIYANEPFLLLVGTDSKNLSGKNIEFTPVALLFEDFITEFIKNLKEGVSGKEWIGEILLRPKDITLFCRIAPTVFDDGRKGVTIILEDITQRKEAEQKVEQSERQFRLLAENSLDMISRIKPDGTRIYVSPAYKTTLGYKLEELIGKNNNDFIHPNDAHVLESLRTILTHENPSTTVTFRTKHKDGHYIWVESAVKTIFDDNTRELSEYYTVTRDITQRKKAEELLKESEERYRTLVEISPDPVIIHQKGEIFFVNPATLNLLGASHNDEIIGKNVLDFIQPDFREKVRKNIQKDLDGEATPLVELQMLRLDGTTILVEGKGVKTYIDGKTAIQVALKDITKSKRAAIALRESEEKYRTLIERANDVICIIQDGVVKMCNPRFPEFWGGTMGEIIGKNISDFVHPDCLPTIIRRYNQRMAGENPPSIYESIFMRKDGSKSFVELNAGIISYEGRPADLIIVRDINERKNSESKLRESDLRLRIILDNTEDLIIMQDTEGRYIYFNLAARYGVPMETATGLTPYDFLDRASADHIVERVKTIAKTGQTMHEETPVIWNSQKLWFSDSLSPIKDANGTVTGVVTISQNITERKRAESALRESETTARALMNAPTDSVLLINDQGIILALNEIAASRFGKRSDELIGSMSYDLLPKEIAQLRRSLMAPVLEKKEMVRFMDERADRWYDTVAYPILNETGEVKKIAIIARDITEQKAFETRLLESEQMYKRLLEQTFDAIAIHKKGKIAFLNGKAAKILGAARPEDLIGKSIFEFIHPDSRNDLEDRVQKLTGDQGTPVPVITEKFIRTDGSTVTVEVLAISFDDNGTPAFRVAFREISPCSIME